MNLKIFARKISGQFAPVLGGQFNRFVQQAKEIDELKEITLTPPPPLPKGKLSTDEIVKIFFIHLFFGIGFFYVDRTVQRKFLYPAFGLYALFDVILAGLDIEPFKSDEFGFTTFIISLVVCYLIGYIDVYYHRYKISQEENSIHTKD